MKYPIEEYTSKIKSGEIIACDKIIRVYCDILKPIVAGEDPRFYFDPRPGQKFADFCSKLCKQSKAPFAGKPLDLLLWQKAKYDALLGIKCTDTKLRRFDECFNPVSRKNGKSTEAASFDLYMCTDCHGAEVYNVANSFPQGMHLWNESKSMIRKSEWLSRHFKATVAPPPTIRLEEFDSIFSVFTNNDDTKDGYNISCASIDEAHELDRGIYDVIRQGTGSRLDPVINIITTAGFVRDGFYDAEYATCVEVLNNPESLLSLLPLIYELDSEKEMNDERMWIKANPSIGVIKPFAYIRKQISRAKIDLGYLNTVKVKDFNLVGIQGLSWLRAEDIERGALGPYTKQEIEDPKFLDQFDGTLVIGCYDLSKTTDITAYVILLFDPKKMCVIIKPMFWVTQAFLKSDWFTADKSAASWLLWIKQGYVRVCSTVTETKDGRTVNLGESTINYHEVSDYISDEFEKHNYIFSKMMYDPWSALYLKYDIAGKGWSCDAKGAVQEPVPQNFKNLSAPTQLLASYLHDGRICYLNNPVMKLMFSKCSIVVDDNGNIMLKKAGFQSMNKIDGPACTVDGFAEICRNEDVYFAPRE